MSTKGLTKEEKTEAAKSALRKAKAAEEAAKRQADKKVMIEKVINLKLMCDYAVSCSYGDIVLIIAMLRDYVSLLDDIKQDDMQYMAYYRERFLHIAEHLSEQIGYDYDKAVEKCLKNKEKEDADDIGEEAMALAVKYAGKGKKKAKDNEQSSENTQEGQTADVPQM